MLWVALALAAPPHAALELHSRSEHVQIIGDRVWPTGVPVPLVVRNRHDDLPIKLETQCTPLAVRFEGAWLSGEGSEGPTKKLGPAREGLTCTWTGRWSDGVDAGAGTFGVALQARINGDAVVAGGGTVAWKVQRVQPEPIEPDTEVRIPVKRGFAATPDGRLTLGFQGPGLLQPGLQTAELRAWVDGKPMPLWLSKTRPDDPQAERVAAGWRVRLVDVFPEGEDVVVLRVSPK
jgi:hypothetical protein